MQNLKWWHIGGVLFFICIHFLVCRRQNVAIRKHHRWHPIIKNSKWDINCSFVLAIPHSGVHCEINIDDCNPFFDPLTKEPKCFNKGKCVDQIGGYQCICPAGYVGERCEGDVNECLSNPCDPRGTHSCIQLTNNYRCECRTGYTGEPPASYLLEGEVAQVWLKWFCFVFVSFSHTNLFHGPVNTYI